MQFQAIPSLSPSPTRHIRTLSKISFSFRCASSACWFVSIWCCCPLYVYTGCAYVWITMFLPSYSNAQSFVCMCIMCVRKRRWRWRRHFESQFRNHFTSWCGRMPTAWTFRFRFSHSVAEAMTRCIYWVKLRCLRAVSSYKENHHTAQLRESLRYPGKTYTHALTLTHTMKTILRAFAYERLVDYARLLLYL